MVNRREALLNAVSYAKRKMLTRLDQKRYVVKSGDSELLRRSRGTTGEEARPNPHRDTDGTW
jgi:hypothetical protein